MKEKTLRYIETNSTDAYYNFATEHYLTTVAPREEMLFLFWRTTPTLMIGKYQNPYEEIDVAYAREHDIAIVRRPSGGGTIFTDLGGWQFSFIDPHGSEEIEFAKYTTPILEALRALGLPVTFTGRNDLLLDGKKISGNAQYKIDGRTVHHGSLLFATDLDEMTAATRPAPHKIASKSIHSVRERVTNIEAYLDEPLSIAAFKKHVVAHIAGDNVEILTEEEKKAIAAIAQEKFRNPEAIYGNTPKFSIEREEKFAGGLVRVHLDVAKGVIRDVQFHGDFFATERIDVLKQAIVGTLYEKTAILEAIRTSDTAQVIYGVAPEKLVRLIVS